MKGGSLRLRLFVAGAVSIVAALALSAFGLSLLFESHAERREVADLTAFLDQIVAGLERGADGELTVVNGPADPRFSRPLSGLYWQVQDGVSTVRSRSLWDTALEEPIHLPANGILGELRLSGPGGSDLIAVGRSLILPPRLGGDRIQAIVASDASAIVTASRAFTAELLPYLLIIGALLMMAAYAQITVGLMPLAAVRRRLAAIRQGASRRLGREFPDEILPLAAEVDALLDAREAELVKARARASDLAHGLKTPLQVLAGDIKRLWDRGEDCIARDVEEVADTMKRHVERELVRARTATGGTDARASVAEVVGRIVKVVKRTPAGEPLHFSSSIAADMTGRIDSDDLAEALGNLIENATRHATSSVSVRADRVDGYVVIRVGDDGPGIPAERLEEALARGGRLDQVGEGAGLGLAIVREIAEAWKGRLEVRTASGGLDASFHVPDADEPTLAIDRQREECVGAERGRCL